MVSAIPSLKRKEGKKRLHTFLKPPPFRPIAKTIAKTIAAKSTIGLLPLAVLAAAQGFRVTSKAKALRQSDQYMSLVTAIPINDK